MNRTQKIFLLISVYTFLTFIFAYYILIPYPHGQVINQLFAIFITGLVGFKLFRDNKVFLLISVYTFLTFIFAHITDPRFFCHKNQILVFFITGLIGIMLFKDKKVDKKEED